ncbi:50S ribosomal protein L28 [Candidatus Parcubacteria bacterium]|nr:MAG: 50S ribosomal protein L28 [Candidatus Parcubacteria bacterium]
MRQCAVCGKGSVIRGKRRLLRGHYNPTGTSRKYPNLQWAKVGGTRKRVCVRCMKKLGRKS